MEAAILRVPRMTITRDFYDAFQRGELDEWDSIVSDDVLVNSPVGFGVRGLSTFKDFARQFNDLAYRIDLVDEHLAVDAAGDGRAFITFTLHWKHTKDFGGLPPTGREGTSVETLLLTIASGKIVRMDVADNTFDLGIYVWERGWPVPHNQRPDPIVQGIDRRVGAASASTSPTASS
jgi:ketosteroid isomerase-like protein